MDSSQLSRVIYLVLLLAAVGGWIIVEYRNRMGQALRVAMAWGLIFVGVMAGYGLWNDLQINPIPKQLVNATGAVEIPRAADGHYYVTVQINGTPVRFVVDTGATNMVLSRTDAKRLGIDPDGLVYLGQANTANGTVRTARMRLPLVELAGYRDENFSAWVNDAEMDGSLLGMDYLGKFRIEIAADRMILRR